MDRPEHDTVFAALEASSHWHPLIHRTHASAVAPNASTRSSKDRTTPNRESPDTVVLPRWTCGVGRLSDCGLQPASVFLFIPHLTDNLGTQQCQPPQQQPDPNLGLAVSGPKVSESIAAAHDPSLCSLYCSRQIADATPPSARYISLQMWRCEGLIPIKSDVVPDTAALVRITFDLPSARELERAPTIFHHTLLPYNLDPKLDIGEFFSEVGCTCSEVRVCCCLATFSSVTTRRPLGGKPTTPASRPSHPSRSWANRRPWYPSNPPPSSSSPQPQRAPSSGDGPSPGS